MGIIGIEKTPSIRCGPYYEFTIYTNFGQKRITIPHSEGLAAMQEVDTYLINLTPCGQWDTNKPLGKALHADYQWMPHEEITSYKTNYFHANGGVSICEPIYENSN